MKSDNEIIIGDGKTNNIPKTMNISHRLLNQEIIADKNNIKENKKESIDKITINKYIKKFKSVGSISTTSINSNTEKIKKVTFSTVSIIRIKKYKEFNKLNTFKADETNNKNNKFQQNEVCFIF